MVDGQCRILYSDIRRLHENINNPKVASKQSAILLWSKTLVSNIKQDSEIVFLSFKKPLLLRYNVIKRAQGMVAYIRSDCSASHKTIYEFGCHGSK